VIEVDDVRAELRPSLLAGLVVATGVSAVVFVWLAVVVWHAHGLVALDGTYGLSLRNTRLERVALLGSPQVVLPVVGVGAVAWWLRGDRFAAVLCAVGPALAGLCETGAKHVVGRTTYSALSYPSGHVTLAAALTAVVAVLSFRAWRWRAAAAVTLVVAVVPVVVGVALVRLGWHFPTDVVGGAALGVGVVSGVAVLLAWGSDLRDRTTHSAM